MGVLVRPHLRLGKKVLLLAKERKGMVVGSMLMLPATSSGHSSLRRIGWSAPMEWLMR